MGRSDDMFIVRGVNIYPSHIDEILSRIKGIGSEYQIHLDRLEDGKDYMTIKVEREEAAEPGNDRAHGRIDRKDGPQRNPGERQGRNHGLSETSPDRTQVAAGYLIIDNSIKARGQSSLLRRSFLNCKFIVPSPNEER